MIKLAFPKTALSDLAKRFREDGLESFAFVLARSIKTSRNNWRLVFDSVHVPTADEYDERSASSVQPNAAFRLRVEKLAHRQGLSLVYCHSHPRERGTPSFSALDDQSERVLAPYSRDRIGSVPHVALLVGSDGFRARELGCGDPVELFEVGRRVIRHFPSTCTSLSIVHDRQVRAFGEEGQLAIQAFRIAIIGLGGTGSVTAQQLAYLGVRWFLLIDPDVLDETNLNRVVGARVSDVGRPKVGITRRMIKQIVPNAEVTVKQGDVLEKDVGALLLDCDLVFCCTDSDGSRHFVNQLAYQYFIPVIDMGVAIQVVDDRVTHIAGRVQMLAPGLACLVCNDGTLSPDEVRLDLSNEVQRQADPYFLGRVNIKQPSVVTLNSLVASAATTMFLAAVAGVPTDVRLQFYRGIPGILKAVDDTPRSNCVNCSEGAFYGKGALYDLPVRAA